MSDNHESVTGASPAQRDERGSQSTRRTFMRAAGVGVGGLTLGSGVGTVAAAVPTPRLHTSGRWIKDPNGNRVKLRGLAPADPGFYRRFHPKSVEEVLWWATDEDRGWYPNHVRLPVTQDSVEYFGLETLIDEILRPAVDLLATRGVYAMVDYHLIRPYTADATDEAEDDYDAYPDELVRNFWNAVAPEFADDEHVIYELFNEPTLPGHYGDDEQAWLTWRDAAQPWVDLVRDHAPETPLIIGSPRWTSVPHMAPEHPFDGENLIYSGHIYPDNGSPDEFDDVYGAPASDVPIVITEFGWDPDGGNIDRGTNSGWGRPFREWVEGYENVGWTAWCFDDSWAPTMFDSSGEGASDDWSLKDGDEQHGGFVKAWLEETKDDMIPESPVDDDAAPPAPSGLTVTDTTEISVALEWDGVTDDGEAGLSHYDVYVDAERVHQTVGDVTAATIGGLEAATTYEVGVAAVDAVGNESERTTAVVETIAPDAAQSPYADHAIPGRIEAEDFDEGGQGISYYDTTSTNQGGAAYRNTTVDVGDAAESGYNIGYVEPGEWWEYTVDVDSSGSYELTVNVASGADDGGALRVEVDRATIASQDVWNTGGWDQWEEIRVGEVDLPAGERIVRVVAEEGAWNFDWMAFGDTDGGGDDTTPPTPPANLSVTGATTSSVDVRWDVSSDDGGSGLEGYNVYVDGGLDRQVSASITETTVADLAADTEYEIGVAAVDAAGNESSTATVIATTDAEGGGDDVTPPTTPANLAVAGATASSVALAWDASTDEESGVDHYAVSVDGETDHTVAADTTETTVDGVAPATEYEFGVVAVDVAGNRSPAATVAAITDEETGGSDPDALVVNDYDGDPSWPGENDLGNWNGAGSFENGGGSGEVVDGALELAYDSAGWIVEQLNRDISDYSTLVVRVGGADGGEGDHFSIALGGAQATFSSVADREIGTSPADVRIDLEAMGVDRTSPGELRLNFWEGGAGAGAITIDEIRLE